MSSEIIADSFGVKTPDEAKQPNFIGNFGDVISGIRGPSLETLTRNKRLTLQVAGLLREERPDWSERLIACHRRIQHGQGGWLTDKYCRLRRYCLNCQAVHAGLVRDLYNSSVLAFQRNYSVTLQMQSIVLHLYAGFDKPDPEDAMHSFAPVIPDFNARLREYRSKHNAKVMATSRPRRMDLLGPILCVPHIMPASMYRVNGRRMARPLRLHLHILAANHPRFAKREFLDLLQDLWFTSANASPNFKAPTSSEIKLERRLTEDPEHTANTIAYTSRLIKPGWGPGRVVMVAGYIEQSPQLGKVYIAGRLGPKRQMPNSFVLRGKTLEFDWEEWKYV